MLSQLQAEEMMEQDPLQSMCHRLWCLEAKIRGFGEREAQYLAFWRWLASQRGGTRYHASLKVLEGANIKLVLGSSMAVRKRTSSVAMPSRPNLSADAPSRSRRQMWPY
jgi:hypothetical protein